MKQMKWISVKDKLPDNGQIVIIEWADNAYFPAVARFRTDHLKQFVVPFRNDRSLEEVSYWMPLPEPPKVTINNP